MHNSHSSASLSLSRFICKMECSNPWAIVKENKLLRFNWSKKIHFLPIIFSPVRIHNTKTWFRFLSLLYWKEEDWSEVHLLKTQRLNQCIWWGKQMKSAKIRPIKLHHFLKWDDWLKLHENWSKIENHYFAISQMSQSVANMPRYQLIDYLTSHTLVHFYAEQIMA